MTSHTLSSWKGKADSRKTEPSPTSPELAPPKETMQLTLRGLRLWKD